MSEKKKLSKLLRHLNIHEKPEYADILISGITYNSKDVTKGDIFVAISGNQADGHDYIKNAIEHGAVVIIGSKPLGDFTVPYFRVDNTRAALAKLAAAMYDFPAIKMIVIGVTGTDGKTTTVNLIYNILRQAGLKAGMISTVNAVIGDEMMDTGFHVTTPASPQVQKFLALMVEKGVTHVVLEATSHGLAQHRLDECYFDIGVVTNVTHEHLDFHGNYENYLAAKGKLFQMVNNHSTKKYLLEPAGILNRDDSSYSFLSSLLNVQEIVYSLSDQADIWAEDISISGEGIKFIVNEKSGGMPYTINSSLIGEYNVSNCLAAIAVTRLALNLPSDAIQDGISGLKAIPGRMEKIDLGQDFIAIVDFAHTPNALIRALKAARKMTNRRVIAVFGSAGLRDREKRRLMADASAELADITILTAEDPRTESLTVILEEMAAGMINKGMVEERDFWRIPDRREAIRKSVNIAEPGDLVISLGKGHEQSMCFGDTEFAWDDRIAMRAALSERLQISGPKMPFLPEWE